MEAARTEAHALETAAAAARASADARTAAASKEEEQLAERHAALLCRLQELEEREVDLHG